MSEMRARNLRVEKLSKVGRERETGDFGSIHHLIQQIMNHNEKCEFVGVT